MNIHTLENDATHEYFKKSQNWEKIINGKKEKIEKMYGNIPPIIMTQFKKLLINLEKNPKLEEKLDSIAFLIPFEWGMSQGILGNSATEFTVKLINFFCSHTNLIVKKNFDFINMSDDALICMELVSKDIQDLFLTKMNEFMKLYGMELSVSKCGFSQQDKCFFNSNSWYPREAPIQEKNRYIKEVIENVCKLKDGSIKIEPIIESKKTVEVFHSSRYLKQLLQDTLSVDVNTEWYSKHANWSYLLKLFSHKEAHIFETIFSMGFWLSRFHFLYMGVMSKYSPEFSGFCPVARKMNREITILPAISKLLRGSITGMEYDKMKAFKLSSPKYSAVRMKERFENALKKVILSNDYFKTSPDYIKYITEILSSGSKEDRSLKLLLLVGHKPFYIYDHKTIIPFGKVLLKKLSINQMSALFQIFQITNTNDDFDSFTFTDWRNTEGKKDIELEDLIYMIKGTMFETSTIDLYTAFSKPSYERDQYVLVPCARKDVSMLPFEPFLNESPVNHVFKKVYPDTWLLPQIPRNKMWIHEGVYMREFYYVDLKYRLVIGLKDMNIVIWSCYVILDDDKILDISDTDESKFLFNYVKKMDPFHKFQVAIDLKTWMPYQEYKYNMKLHSYIHQKRKNDIRVISSKKQNRMDMARYIAKIHGYIEPESHHLLEDDSDDTSEVTE